MGGACRGGSLAAGCSAPFLSLPVMPLWACPSGSRPRAETVSSFKESVNIHCHDASDLSEYFLSLHFLSVTLAERPAPSSAGVCTLLPHVPVL